MPKKPGKIFAPPTDLPKTFEAPADVFARLMGTVLDSTPPAAKVDHGADHLQIRDEIQFRNAVAELAARQIESLKLYEPLPEQERFHRARSRQRLLRGSNRGGKTLPAMIEVARAVTGNDPYGKYPDQDGRCYLVGLDLLHVGQVFFPKLFKSGAFKIIRDKTSGRWRAYRPWEEADHARKREAKPAPPLIPQRYIESIAWEDRAKNIPRMVKLRNGWEMTFFSSGAKPPQGMDLDLVAFDEEIEDGEWYPEMTSRLLDRNGMLIWSATPQAGNDQLLALSERAHQDSDLPHALVTEYVILLADNPFIDQSEKDTLASLLDDDQREVRIGGEFAASKWRVFPEFSREMHIRECPEVPAGWTRYMTVDPGRQVCAVLFGAVPPPDVRAELGYRVLLYDELYLRDCSAKMFGDNVARKAEGQAFEMFVIDGRMGRQTEMGSGVTVQDQYAAELRKRKVASRRTQSGFVHGLDDPISGVEMVRSLLSIGPSGSADLAVRAGCLPHLEAEIKKYRFRKNGRIITDKPEDRGPVHLMGCLRYLAGIKPRYCKPTFKTSADGAYAEFRRRAKAKQSRDGISGVNLGPSRS